MQSQPTDDLNVEWAQTDRAAGDLSNESEHLNGDVAQRYACEHAGSEALRQLAEFLV